MSAIPLRTLAFGLGLALAVTAGSSSTLAAMKSWTPTAQDRAVIALDRQVHDKRLHGKRHHWQHFGHRKLVPHHYYWGQFAKRHRWQHHYRPLPHGPFAWRHQFYHQRPHFHGRPPHFKYWNPYRGWGQGHHGHR